MDFFGHDENGDFEYGEGYWKCEDCNYMIYEKDL